MEHSHDQLRFEGLDPTAEVTLTALFMPDGSLCCATVEARAAGGALLDLVTFPGCEEVTDSFRLVQAKGEFHRVVAKASHKTL